LYQAPEIFLGLYNNKLDILNLYWSIILSLVILLFSI
jgi:hypothetical protein